MIDCAQCPKRRFIAPGTPYEDTPCASCRLRYEAEQEKHEYIGIATEKRDRLISFFKRTEKILTCRLRKKILYMMLEHPAFTERDIAAKLDIRRSLVSYHASIIRHTIPEIFGREYKY